MAENFSPPHDFIATATGSFEAIRGCLADMPPPSAAAADRTRQRDARLTKPPGALARLEDIAIWLASWQDRAPPRINRPLVTVFAGNHGVVERGVSAFPPDVTRQMVANFSAGGAAINQLARLAGADLRVVDMGLDTPTADMSTAPAMSKKSCLDSLRIGMEAVRGTDLLCVGEMGIGNTTAAAALSCALFGGDPSDWVGPGTGLSAGGVDRKRTVITAAITCHGETLSDPFEALRRVGGHELAAIAGAILSARMQRIPVLLDGYVTAAAAAVLYRANASALDHCLAAHCSAEPGHIRLLEFMGQKPLLDLGMRLGEGSGAALALNIVRAAVAVHAGMATFDEAGVSGAN